MTYQLPPLRMPGSRALVHPITRPFNLDRYMVLGLLPEINTKWIDYSGKTNHGAISAAALKHDGRFGPALSFNGTTSRIFIASTASLRLPTAFSIMMWARRDGISSDDYGTLIDKSNATATRNYQIYWWDTGAIEFRVYDKTNAANRTTSVAGYNETGTWRQIIGVYDGTNITLYIDTIASTPTAAVGTVYDGIQALRIGKLGYVAGSSYHFNGTIDEVLIFNRELKPWEIEALYEMGKPA